MLKSLFSAAVFILGAGVSFAGDPVVSNVRAQQRGGGSKLVDIYYDVADSDGDRQTVAVAITDGGTPIPATSLTGAVGANVTPGSGKQIVWDSGADWPGNLSVNVRATVTAQVGDNTFLWRPVTETLNGRANVLLPANIQATTITVNGEGPAEYAGRRNGNRQQYYLSRTGAAYGLNVIVIAVGTGRQWVVPYGGIRWSSE